MASPRVTITLGRSGQVVERGGAMSGDRRADSRQLAGSKRVVRDRMYSHADGDDTMFTMDKRQRVDGMNFSQGSIGTNGSQLSKHDLRLKLMRKNLSKRISNTVEERQLMDPRGKLSKTVRPSVRIDMLQRRHELNDSTDDLLPRTSYSPRTVDGFRARSPDRNLNTSRVFSPPRSFDEIRQVSTIRTIDDPRSGQALNIGVDDASRRKYPTPFTMKSSPDTPNLITYHAPTYGKSSHVGEQPFTVASLLHSLDLGKYAILFQAEEVDMTALRQMGDKDLKELGIPMRDYIYLKHNVLSPVEGSVCKPVTFDVDTPA